MASNGVPWTTRCRYATNFLEFTLLFKETVSHAMGCVWDFNEILNSDEKLGWLERDSRQMGGFRECLCTYGLIDMGFVGQRFT